MSMKAHDLAAWLLRGPDADVVFQTVHATLPQDMLPDVFDSFDNSSARVTILIGRMDLVPNPDLLPPVLRGRPTRPGPEPAGREG